MEDPTAGAAEVAARLRELSARLTAVAAAVGAVTYEARAGASRQDEVSVTATGHGQVKSVYVGPRAMRSGSATLSAMLCGLLNQAVRGARKRAAQAMREAVDPGMREALSEDLSPPGDAAERFVTELTGRVVSARSPDGKVAVTASGAGEILSVELAADALRGFDNVSLGERIAAAANGALDAAQRLQLELVAGLRDDEATVAAALDARLGAFTRRMDELLDQLDQADRRITGLQ